MFLELGCHLLFPRLLTYEHKPEGGKLNSSILMTFYRFQNMYCPEQLSLSLQWVESNLCVRVHAYIYVCVHVRCSFPVQLYLYSTRPTSLSKPEIIYYFYFSYHLLFYNLFKLHSEKSKPIPSKRKKS